MGYWSVHPMGGDAPLDHKYRLDALLFTKEECEDYETVRDKKEYKKRLEANLQKATEIDFTREANFYDFTNAKIEHVEGEDGRNHISFENLGITPYTEDCSFIVPFLVAEHEIKITNQVLSRKLKNMIGDGGAWQREYEIPTKANGSYPTIYNNWNGLQTPYDYAKKLYDLWDGLMEGTIPFSSIEEDKGLGASIKKMFDENNGQYTGPVNVK